MTTANDIVSGALRAISSIMPGEAIPGGEAEVALGVLNNMLAAWSADNFMPPFRTLESFPLVVGQSSYTIGSGANFSTVRPDYVTYVFRRDSNNLDYPLAPLTKEQYDSVLQKNLSSLPQWYYYDTQYPNGVIYLYPADVQADTLYIESTKPINQFSSLSASMNLPGEYFECLKYQLARRLVPEYGYPISTEMQMLIDESYDRIVRKNSKPKAAVFDQLLVRPKPYSIYTG